MDGGRQVAQDGYVFFLDEVIGRGASAEVVAAREDAVVAGMTPLELAAKILHLSRESEAPDEIRRMHRVADFPNVVGYRRVVRLDDRFAEYSGRIALVLERGLDSLGSWRRNRVGAAVDDEVGQVLMGAARGLKSLHRNHVAHGDLHAGNVLLTRAGWKIADLSASRPVDPRTGVSAPPPGAGSPPVFSPERHRNRLASTFDDMWALGVLLVFTATGNYPFGSQLAPEVVELAVARLGPRLQPIAAGLLAWDPHSRLTAGQLLTRLEADELGMSEIFDPTIFTARTRRMIPPAGVANYRPGHAEVFHVHETSVEHAWTLDGGHSWSQWHPMQFDIPILDVTAGSKGPGQEEVFALGEDGIIRHRWLIVDPATDQHDGWSHCQELSCPPLPRVRQLAAASIAPGHLEVFAVDATGQLWSRFYWSDKGWSEWSPWEAPGRLDGVQASAVRNPQDPATRAVLIVEEPTGTQWARAYRISRPGWGDWTRVGDAVPTTRGIAEFVADRRGEALQWEDGALLPLNGTWLGSTTDNTGVTLDSAHPKAIALPATSRAMHRGDQPD